MSSRFIGAPPPSSSRTAPLLLPGHDCASQAAVTLASTMRTCALLLVPLALAGCGGAARSTATNVADCLNTDGFLVRPSGTTVEGTSPGGVGFTLTLYRTAAAATAAYEKASPKTTLLVETGVIDFGGTPPAHKGGPPAKLAQTELATIKTCIDQTGK